MLRIGYRSEASGERLELVGRLTVAYLPELERAVAAARLRSARITVDLSELIFLDGEGARFLQELRGGGVQLQGGSLFVAELLGPTAPAASPSLGGPRGGPCRT